MPHVQPVRHHRGARRTALHPAIAYGVQGVPHIAGEAVVGPTQPSPPYGQIRTGQRLHLRDLKFISAISRIDRSGCVSFQTNREMCKAENDKSSHRETAACVTQCVWAVNALQMGGKIVCLSEKHHTRPSLFLPV